jgi:hypothetical protein
MSERFELLDIEGDISGKLRLIYGSGPADPAPFVLTLTPQYVARASGKTPPVSFHEIEKYADDNAGDRKTLMPCLHTEDSQFDLRAELHDPFRWDLEIVRRANRGRLMLDL